MILFLKVPFLPLEFVASLKADKGDEHKIASIVNLAYNRGEKGM